jgi:hypothetical protein
MLDFIKKETKKIMLNCCTKYAKEQKLNVENVQLVLGLDEYDENTYTICENYVPKKYLDIMEVLGVRIDFKGYSRLAPPFIAKAVLGFAESKGLPIEDTKILCLPIMEEKLDMMLFLYNNNTYIETITFEDLFKQEYVELPT